MEEFNFDINNKRGTASEKTLEELNRNNKKYKILKDKLIFDTNHRFGLNFLKEYHAPNNFNFANLDESTFKQRCLQKSFMPFSNEQIEKFITMDKFVVNKPFYGNVRGKNVYGTYMVSNENGKPVVFALTISRGTQDNENMMDFSVKLDMLVAGKEWLQLARFDSMGAGHPNYIIDGKLAKNLSEVEFAPTPHIHINSEETQVLFSTQKNCEYMTSKNIEQLKELRNNSDRDFFRSSLDVFLQFSNVKTKINSKIADDYMYDKNQPLFDNLDVYKMGKVTYPNNSETSTTQEMEDLL